MEQIGNILHQFFYELGIDKPILKFQALDMWSKVVGEKISEVTEPRRITDGKIFVKVKNDTWRNELVYYKKNIIEKLNNELGSRIVKDIILI